MSGEDLAAWVDKNCRDAYGYLWPAKEIFETIREYYPSSTAEAIYRACVQLVYNPEHDGRRRPAMRPFMAFR